MTEAVSRGAMLARTPDVYLADGWVDDAGATRAALLGADATGAVAQLMEAGTAPQELGFTVAALTLLLDQQAAGPPALRLAAALAEALATVARAIQQPNNAGLCAWIGACARRVDGERDLVAFQAHLRAVDRQYGLVVAMQPG